MCSGLEALLLLEADQPVKASPTAGDQREAWWLVGDRKAVERQTASYASDYNRPLAGTLDRATSGRSGQAAREGHHSP